MVRYADVNNLLNYNLMTTINQTNNLRLCSKRFEYKYFAMIIRGNGQNYENQNVENQKDLRNLRRQSEHRKE